MRMHLAMSRWAAAVLARRAWAAASWALLFAMAAVLAARLPAVVQGGADPIPGSETGAVIRVMEREFGRGSYYVTPVVLENELIEATDPRFAAMAGDITTALESSPQVQRVATYWNLGDRALLGKDKHSALLLVTPDVGSFSEAEALTPVLRDSVERRLGDGFAAHVTGTTAMLHDLDAMSSSDLLGAERIGLPISLLILLIVFRAPLAALLPIVLALVAITICNAALVLLSRAMPVSVFALNTSSMIGLGVGIDYALFILSRYRKARRAGADPAEAAHTAVTEVGGAVLFSASTVAVGFLALLWVDAPFLRAIAFGGTCVVAVSGLAAVTLLPALMTWLGDRIDWPWRPRRQLAGDVEAEGGAWARWSHAVMAHPWPALIAASVVVIGLALPALELRNWNVGARDLPQDVPSRAGYEVLADRFTPGWMGPTVLVFEARAGETVWAPSATRAILATAGRIRQDPRVDAVTGFASLADALEWMDDPPRSARDFPATLQATAENVVSEDGRYALLAVLPAHDPADRTSAALVRDLRASGFPEAAAAGLTVRAGGPAAGFVDFDDELLGGLPRVIALVLTLTFVVLLVMFRSIVIPIKAIVLNLLSVLAAYGFLVLVFQHGAGSGLLRLDPPGGLNSFIVLMLFTILFGLSMDYEVFLLSRIRHAWHRTGDTRVAVAAGLQETAGIITSAALIMISIFAAFGFTRLTATREFGLGLAFAVLVDATLIRMVMVPSLMVLAGRWNWWWPGAEKGHGNSPVAILLAGFARMMSGARPRWAGCTPQHRQRIYFANHTSHLDALVLWSVLPPRLRALTRPVAARDYWDGNALRRYLACCVFRAVLIDRNGEASSTNGPIADILDAMGRRHSLIFFPEGSRGIGPDLQPFRAGLFRLAERRPDIELIPVYLTNLERVMPRGARLPVPLQSEVIFGAPMRREPDESKADFLARARRVLEEMRPQ